MEKPTESTGLLEDCLEELNQQLREELLQKCELLSNQNFLERYQRAIEVAEELHLASIVHYRDTGHFNYFRRVGVNNITDFLRKLNQGDWEAIATYEEVLKTLNKE